MDRYHLKIEGRVQFVGFRYLALNAASRLALTGWVRNCYDEDSVEIEIQGKKESIDEFIKALHKGNGFSRIDNIISDKINCRLLEKSFKVVY